MPGAAALSSAGPESRVQASEGDLVFFLLDVVPKLDLSRFYAPMRRKPGRSAVCPAMMVRLWLYAYCVGVVSSRKSALACEREFGLSGDRG